MDFYKNLRMYSFVLFMFCFVQPVFMIFKFLRHLYGYFSIENVKGKVILITGAASGIGEEIAYEYARRGAYLVIVDKREDLFQKVANKARKLGSPEVFPICADVSNVDDCKRFVDEAVTHFGRLDHVVNNAGILSYSSIEDIPDVTILKSVMEVNFWGSVYTTYFAIPHLKKTKGKILVNASASAYVAPPRLGIYSASKAALLNFYEVLRVELGPEISITTATVGYTESGITRGKLLSNEGKIVVDEAATKMMINGVAMVNTNVCAKAMVKGVCLNRRSVTEPKYFKLMFFLKTICPEIIDWYHQLYFSKTGTAT